jgi:hypothetical protein
MTDTDAIAYVNAVEAADGQLLEFGVGKAINDFVVGCKLDGIWSAIKASCILAGARTLAGALVPLAGTAPTNNNFVSGDYNRKTGLVGDGSTKNLLSNYTLLPANVTNTHLSVFPTLAHSVPSELAGGASQLVNGYTGLYVDATNSYFAAWTLTNTSVAGALVAGSLVGVSRSSSSSQIARRNGAQTVQTLSVVASPANTGVRIFARDLNGAAQSYMTNARLAFYSIGESLDLALLDARVTALITAFGVAIP